MKKSVFRLITLVATVALLCGVMLCFSLTSSAENLLTENWQAEDPSQASCVSYVDGVLSLDATGGVDIKAAQTVMLEAGSYRFSATKTGSPVPDLMVHTAAGDVPEGKYEEAGHVDFTLTTAEEVTLKVSEYRNGTGSLSDLMLTTNTATPTTTQGSQSGSETGSTASTAQPSYAPSGANLIVNGAFNNGTNSWTLQNLIDGDTAKVQDGALVVNDANAWHASVTATINGAIKPDTLYTIKYEASGVNNMQVRVHKSDGDGSGASVLVEPGETSFTTDGLTSSANFYVTIENVVDGAAAGTFDNFILVEGTDTNVTEPATTATESNASQGGTTGTRAPAQTGKIMVWSGTIARDFTTNNTVAIISVDELTNALRDDIAANGVPAKYEIEAVASYTSGPSGYTSWGIYQESPYMELWADKGSTMTSAMISDAKLLGQLANKANLCLYSDDTGDVANVQSLTLYAYHEGEPSTSETTASETVPTVSETQTSATETQPTQSANGILVWSGAIDADYTTVNGVVAIDNADMVAAFNNEMSTYGTPEKIEVVSAFSYLGGDSGYAAIGLYSNGQVIWPDAGYTTLNDVTFSNLQPLGADAALVVFSGNADTLHIDNLAIYVTRAQAVQSSSSVETTGTGASTAVKGDTNGDGVVSMKDVLALRKFLAGLATTDFDEATADVNGDGVVSMKDVLKLRKYLAGLESLD